MWIVEPRELAPKGTGIYHLVASSGREGAIGCCDHNHPTPEEASACPEARAEADRITGIRAPARPDVAELARIGFEAYGESTGGKTWDGKPIPPYAVVAERTPHVARAWEAAVAAILKARGVSA